MGITRAAYYCYCSSLFILLFLLIAHCDARKSAAHIFRALPHSINVIKRLDVIGIVGDHVLLDSTNSQPYDGYGSVSSPFSLPPFDSLPPVPLPETTPPFCLYPPSTPGTIIPSPIGFGGGGAGGGYNSPPPPPPTSSSSNPPILPIESPPPSPPAVSVPIFPNPPTAGGYVPSPTEPILSPPFSYEPSPPFSYAQPSPPFSYAQPSPPFSYAQPSPPFSFPTPSTPTGGFVPSPTVFQPPVVYPPPRGPPPPYKGPKTALWCVAKPAVPDPIVQEAMNYACGSGADCDSLQPNGSCFEPNTLLAHASYAFNSYWQRTRVAGGTCEFGGSAILVTVDPSYDGCHFMYNG